MCTCEPERLCALRLNPEMSCWSVCRGAITVLHCFFACSIGGLLERRDPRCTVRSSPRKRRDGETTEAERAPFIFYSLLSGTRCIVHHSGLPSCSAERWRVRTALAFSPEPFISSWASSSCGVAAWTSHRLTAMTQSGLHPDATLADVFEPSELQQKCRVKRI